MPDTALIPDQTVEANGQGPEVELGAAAGRKLMLTLRVTRILEQESLDVAIFSSDDKATWSPKPILSFPQKFYAGESQILLDMTEHPDAKYLRGAWTLARWGRGRPTPKFTFSVEMRELS